MSMQDKLSHLLSNIETTAERKENKNSMAAKGVPDDKEKQSRPKKMILRTTRSVDQFNKNIISISRNNASS